ncbi:transport protein TonB [Tsuneonella dongtanensis]|uniref:Transport protein TonB n=1 Tax=Tsuneonella dongtanensis TaxID=692370 RepID=A0A1B2ADG9_9SPHN|nr:TonB family protein [Tsuneonella dongtanensis]ANY20177.1 transport protein TonB [Tsuneonella dongtanensis]
MTRLFASFSVLLAQSAIGATAAASIPSPIVTAPAQRTIVRWISGEVRCGDARPDMSGLRSTWPDSTFAGPAVRIADVTFSFAIDAQGRVRSVTPLGQQGSVGGTDLGPSLVASRFPAGQPHETCLVTYSPNATPLSVAPIADLLEFSVRPGPMRLPKEGWDRIAASFECNKSPRPQALVRRYPDPRRVPETPGQQQWTLVAFDLDQSGAATNARIAAGTGSKVLDDAALEAAAGNRFASGAREGCLQPFVRRAGTLDAPELPDALRDESPEGACGGKGNWQVEPRLVYPEHYRLRSIEGWAKLTYDVAPWGAIDNVRVVESQPSADFGRQAQMMLRQAKVVQGNGTTGCSQIVRFRMAGDLSADESPAMD